MVRVTLEAQTGHSGIQFNMDLHPSACTHRGVGKRPGRLLIPDVLRDLIVQDDVCLIRRRHAQLENGQLNARVPQLTRFLHVGDCQIFRTQFLQRAGRFNRAVAIGIGLHHPEKTGVRSHLFAQCVIIMSQGVQIDFRPGAF